jgi:hypothetical protein
LSASASTIVSCKRSGWHAAASSTLATPSALARCALIGWSTAIEISTIGTPA